MKQSLQVALQTKRTFTVDQDRTIGFMGDDLRVYATPWLVRDMEQTCRDFLLEHLDPGEDSVGTRIEIDHMAPTLIGMEITIAATISKIDGRLVVFDFTAHDGIEQTAKGRHKRFIVDTEQTARRLSAKRQQSSG